MGDLMRSFIESVRVKTKHGEKTRVGLWCQSTILKVVWDVTSGIRANLSSKISGTNQAEAGGHVTPEADETREWPPVHKTCQWVAPDIF